MARQPEVFITPRQSTTTPENAHRVDRKAFRDKVPRKRVLGAAVAKAVTTPMPAGVRARGNEGWQKVKKDSADYTIVDVRDHEKSRTKSKTTHERMGAEENRRFLIRAGAVAAVGLVAWMNLDGLRNSAADIIGTEDSSGVESPAGAATAEAPAAPVIIDGAQPPASEATTTTTAASAAEGPEAHNFGGGIVCDGEIVTVPVGDNYQLAAMEEATGEPFAHIMPSERAEDFYASLVAAQPQLGGPVDGSIRAQTSCDGF